MHPFSYLVYGLRISANQPITGLPSRPFTATPDLCLDILGPGSWAFAPIPDALMLNGVKRMEEQWHSLKVWQTGETLHVRYQLTGEQVDFAISIAGDRVQATWSNDFPAADVPAFFLGPVIGCVLKLRGVPALHAGVVAVGDSAIAILGNKGAGKSTLVGAFARQGYPILSDDVAPLYRHDDQFWVHPGYPRLRLWPATLEWLGVFDPNLPRVESIFEKRYFELSMDTDAQVWRFCEQPRPLIAAYVLAEHREEETLGITSISASEGLHTLLGNSYADYILEKEGRINSFRILGQVASSIAIRQLERSRGLDMLTSHCEIIAEDVNVLAEI